MTDPRMSARLEEAGRWFAASRRGVMSLEERARYAGWRADANNAAAMAEFENVWDALESARDCFPPSETRAVRLGSRTRFSRPALVAALCAVSLVIGTITYSGHSAFWTTLDWTDR